MQGKTRVLTKLQVCVSDAPSLAEASVVFLVAALEDDLFHNELRLRHIVICRQDDEELQQGELFDASATDDNRTGGVQRQSSC